MHAVRYLIIYVRDDEYPSMQYFTIVFPLVLLKFSSSYHALKFLRIPLIWSSSGPTKYSSRFFFYAQESLKVDAWGRNNIKMRKIVSCSWTHREMLYWYSTCLLLVQAACFLSKLIFEHRKRRLKGGIDVV